MKQPLASIVACLVNAVELPVLSCAASYGVVFPPKANRMALANLWRRHLKPFYPSHQLALSLLMTRLCHPPRLNVGLFLLPWLYVVVFNVVIPPRGVVALYFDLFGPIAKFRRVGGWHLVVGVPVAILVPLALLLLPNIVWRPLKAVFAI